MIFLWSHLLWLLLAVPVLTAVYFRLLRGKQTAVLYSDLGLVREALGRSMHLRRHIPPLFLLCALVALILAMARPAADMPFVEKDRTLILAIDVSHSMMASDIAPTRLAAAQATARRFVRELPRDVRVGVVAFSGSADIVQVPTRNRRYLAQAIDGLQADSNTGLGIGIIASLVTLFPDAGLDGDFDIFGMGGMRDGGRTLGRPEDLRKAVANKVAPGSYPSATIILLTDGRNTIGQAPLAAARLAVERGIRIYTIGFGTADGKSVEEDGQMTEVGLEEDVLRDVAYATRGAYFYAATAAQLDRIYTELDGQLVREFRQTEVTSFFTAAAALLMLIAAALSYAWFPRSV